MALHGVLLFAAVVMPLLPVFRKKDLAIPVDFTVVLEENLVAPNVPPEMEAPKEKASPRAEPEPEPEPELDPVKPPPLPDPPKEALVLEKKEKPKPQVQKPKEEVKPSPKPEPKAEPKKEFKKGKRVVQQTPVPKGAQPTEDFTKLKPVTTKPLTDKRLSSAEIAKALQEGARAGTRNMIPEDEISRCVVLVKNAMYDAWEQPAEGDAVSRPALLDIRLDSAGRIVSYRIRQSSGSAYFDQTVLIAAANVAPIRGITVAFLKQYEVLTVEFKLE